MQYRYGRTQKLRAQYIYGVKSKDFYTRKRYGITAIEYAEIVKRPCQICGSSNTTRVMDHDHNALGTYRGVLCSGCNSALGWFENRHEQIKEYLNANHNNH